MRRRNSGSVRERSSLILIENHIVDKFYRVYNVIFNYTLNTNFQSTAKFVYTLIGN